MSHTQDYPSTSWERHLQREDNEHAAMTFRVILGFDGRIDPDAFRASLHKVAARHPLLNSVLQDNVGQQIWRPYEGSLIEIQQEQQDFTSFDLRAVPGLAAGVVDAEKSADEFEQRCKVIFDFHHACIDGQAAARFIAEVFRDMVHGGASSVRPLDASLGDRAKFILPQPENQVGTVEGIRNLWHTVRGKTLRFRHAAPSDDGTCTSNRDRVCVASLSKDQSIRIRETLNEMRWKDNDVGVVATFHTLVRMGEVWKDSATKRNAWLTVMNPVDLRDWSDRRRSACNRVGLAYLRRRVGQAVEPGFEDGIFDQLQYVRQKRVGVEFLHGLDAVEKAPRLLQFVRRRRWFDPTASFTCLTNLKPGSRFGMERTGGQWGIGQGRFRSGVFVSSRPPGCALAIASMEAEGKVRITLRADSSCLSTDQIRDFAGSWLSCYWNTAAEAAGLEPELADVEIESCE